MLEKFNPSTLEYYEELAKLSADQLADEWQETTAENHEYMLEVLPPIRWKDSAFMVGECATHTQVGAIYDAHIEINGRYFWRPAPLHKFNPEQYRAEIKNKFNI